MRLRSGKWIICDSNRKSFANLGDVLNVDTIHKFVQSIQQLATLVFEIADQTTDLDPIDIIANDVATQLQDSETEISFEAVIDCVAKCVLHDPRLIIRRGKMKTKTKRKQMADQNEDAEDRTNDMEQYQEIEIGRDKSGDHGNQAKPKAKEETKQERGNAINENGNRNQYSHKEKEQPDLQMRLETQLRDSIQQYQEMERKFAREGKHADTLRQLVGMLKKQLAEHKGGQSSGSNNRPFGLPGRQEAERQPTREERIAEGVKEIFEFYCRQQFNVGRTPTFELIDKTIKRLNLGEFTKFCKNFAIPVPIPKLQELFKKHAYLGRELQLADFQALP
jgi:hypothetical protein